MKTLFSTSNVTLFDRISEYFKMRKYMRRFERERELRARVMEEMREERKSVEFVIE